MHFQHAIWQQILLQTPLWFKVCSWYFFFLEESITDPEGIQGKVSIDSILKGQEKIRMKARDRS